MFVKYRAQALAHSKNGHVVKEILIPHTPGGGRTHGSQARLVPYFLTSSIQALLQLCQSTGTCPCLLGEIWLLIHTHGVIIIRKPGIWGDKLALSRSIKDLEGVR